MFETIERCLSRDVSPTLIVTMPGEEDGKILTAASPHYRLSLLLRRLSGILHHAPTFRQ